MAVYPVMARGGVGKTTIFLCGSADQQTFATQAVQAGTIAINANAPLAATTDEIKRYVG